MIRTMAFALALVAGSAAAGENMDCYNDGNDAVFRYTQPEPEVLRVTDADIAAMLIRIREGEHIAVAAAGGDASMQASLDKGASTSD